MSKQTKITTFFRSSVNTVSGDKNESKKTKSIEIKAENVLNDKKRKFNSSDSLSTVSDQNSRSFVRNKFAKNTRKVCPFYKKIPNTPFAVDAFSYGTIPDISVYFLTHFHSDHYTGLNNSFKHQIYCSQITASLVRNKFKSGLFCLNVIEINSSKDVMGVRVTFFEANHCPGAVVILFELKNGLRYLHTGDFRADHSFFGYQQLICKPIDTIFLDTTYCDPKYDFLPQKQILETIVSISCDYNKKNPKLLIVCGSYSIGKENVFVSIATALNLKVWTNDNKRQIYNCYKNSRIDSLMVSNKQISRLHVLSMDCINESVIDRNVSEYYLKIDFYLVSQQIYRRIQWSLQRSAGLSTDGLGTQQEVCEWR